MNPQSATEGDHIEALLRAKLDQLERQFKRTPSVEVRAAFLRTLRLFTELVLHGKRPTNEDLDWIKHDHQ